MKIKNLQEIIGWYGMFAIIIAFALLSFDIIDSKDMIYQILNITGSLGIIYISFKKKAYQPGVLNVIWLMIALVAFIRIVV